MKLTNLSVAIMVALGVAACGGSDDNGSNKPADPSTPPAPAPDNKPQQPEAKNDDKIVDPTGTRVVDGRDLSKESTVGGLQYIRRDGSDFDRVYNPDKPASATPLLGVSLDEQNPKLTNIVLARRDLEREADKAVRAQFTGGLETEPLTPDGKPQATPSLQVSNFENVDILAGSFKQVGSAVFTDANNRLDPVTHDINTHIQNNIDKDGEFARDRVDHVYTLRYEYRQPYVDYPNSNATTEAAHRAYLDQNLQAPSFTPPGKPNYPLADMEANLKVDANYYTQQDPDTKIWRDRTSHAPNIGVGPWPLPWSQVFFKQHPAKWQPGQSQPQCLCP